MDKNTKSGSEKKFGTKFTSYTIGSEERNEPIAISIIGLDEALKDLYWSKQADYETSGDCPSNWPRATVAANILRALKEYSNYRGVSPSSDPDVSVQLKAEDRQGGNLEYLVKRISKREAGEELFEQERHEELEEKEEQEREGMTEDERLVQLYNKLREMEEEDRKRESDLEEQQRLEELEQK